MVSSVVLDSHDSNDIAWKYQENEYIIDETDYAYKSLREYVYGQNEIEHSHENQSDKVNVPNEENEEPDTENVADESPKDIRKFQDSPEQGSAIIKKHGVCSYFVRYLGSLLRWQLLVKAFEEYTYVVSADRTLDFESVIYFPHLKNTSPTKRMCTCGWYLKLLRFLETNGTCLIISFSSNLLSLMRLL